MKLSDINKSLIRFIVAIACTVVMFFVCPIIYPEISGYQFAVLTTSTVAAVLLIVGDLI